MSEGAAARTRLADAIAWGPAAVARSHRLHRPRGGWCARGSCQQCPLPLGGGLACETPPTDGSAPRPAFDPIRPLGLVGERMEPWFYEHRFLRPRWARQLALGALRRLSAAPQLPTGAAERTARSADLRCEVLVVGAGPAGRGAAATIAGDANVAIVSRARFGGSLALHGRSGTDDKARLERAGAAILPDTVCLGYFGEGRFLMLGPEGLREIRADRVVVATGAYDRPLLVPGVDLPGVIGGRAFAALAAQGAFVQRHRIVVFGRPSEIARAVSSAEDAGVELTWVGGPDEARPTRLLEIRGRRRARGVRFDDGPDRAADVVVLGFTQPTYELQLMLGQTATLAGTPPTIATTGPTELPMLVVGEAAGDAGEGIRERAAAAAAAWFADPASVSTASPTPAGAPATGPPAPDAVVCSCEDVRVRDVDAAIADGFDHPELLKRRTGAATGPCQGKLCLPLVAELLELRRLPVTLPTVRPPIRPVAIADLAPANPRPASEGSA